MKNICIFSILLAAVSLCAFDLSKWEKSDLDIAEYKNGVLHLARLSKKPKSALISRRFSKAEIKSFSGKQLVISAEIEQLASDRGDVVGLSIFGKRKDGTRFSERASLPFKGKHAPVELAVYCNVPQDTLTLYASIEATRGWKHTADALFRNIKITTQNTDTPRWNFGTGSFLCVEKKPIHWNWQATPGLKAELKNNAFHLEGKGVLTLRCQKDRFFELMGSTPEFGALTFELGTTTPLSIDITSYGKKNNTVKLDKITASKNGSIRLKVMLSQFAHYHDLVKFEEISFAVDGKQIIKKCNIVDIDLENDVKNVMPDPSFEEAEHPESNYISYGDYRSEKLSDKLSFSTEHKFHGKRSLEIAPGGFTTLQANDLVGRTAIFSLYAKGNDSFELTFKQQLSKIHGAVSMKIWKKTFKAENNWKRFVFISPDTHKPNSYRSLYIAEIRNTGKTPLYIDAVQLEQNSTKATKFQPQKRTSFSVKINNVFPLSPLAEPKELPDNPEAGKVKITVINPDNTNYSNIPVRGGITFAKGKLFKINCLKITDKNGREIPAQFSTLARRVTTDKSVISVAVDFNTDLKANEKKEFFLEYGKTEFPQKGKNIAEKQKDDIVIDTGKLKLTLTPKADSFIKGCDAFCAVQGIDGKIHRSKADIVRIDENGPQRATVFLRGNALLAWELRLTFIKDQPYIIADYSFENNFTPKDAMTRPVRSIFLELPGGKEYKVDNFSGKQDALFVQRHARIGEFKWDTYCRRNGKKEIIDDLKLSGSGKAGKTAFHILDFAELAPRAIGFKDRKVRFYHYPPEGTALYEIHAGMSGTMRFNYAPDADSVPKIQHAVIYTDPEHTRKSKVFDEFLTRKEMQKYFPKTGNYLDSVFSVTRKFTVVNGFYGLEDYGEFGSRNYYSNHETSQVRNLWTNFLITGDVRDYLKACAHARHQRDIDQVHVRYGTTAVQTHNGYNNSSYSFHTGHFWLTGIIYHYLLTGDRRSYESAVSAMAVLVDKSGLKYPRGRERHRMLFHLAEIYGITGNQIVKQALDRQYNVGGASDRSAYYGAIAYEALEKMYEVTEDKRYLDRMTGEVRLFEKNNRVDVKPMPEDRGMPPTQHGTSDGGRGVMTIFSGSRAALRYNDPELIKFLNVGKGDDPMVIRLLDPRSRDIHLVWITSGLFTMKHFGLKESKIVPDSYSFIAQLTGLQWDFNNYQPFVFEMTPDKNGMCAIDLYRYRMFRYWNKKLKNDYVYCKIFDSKGKLLKSAVLNNNVTWEHTKVQAKSPDGKNLRAEVTFDNDSWGGISSPNKIRLFADRKFGVRNGLNVPVAVYFKAPASGKLEIVWCWRHKNNVEAGSILGAYIESCGGKEVVKASYTIPEVLCDREFNTHTLKLDIPEQFRNKVLKLYITDNKWMSWQVKGLDYPWFGNKASDLD